jgi:type I restriction enzyme S subunit
VQHFVSGGMQPMLSNVTLSTIPFPIPPITEQKRIVAKIDQLMELCNSLGQQIKDSTEKQTAILNAVFARV